MTNLPVGVLISGRGSNLIALHEQCRKGSIAAEIRVVVSSSAQAKGLEYARSRSIPTAVVPALMAAEPEAFAGWLLKTLRDHGVALVVLAGFLRKIPAPVIQAYRNRIVNVHPALLPAFGGKGMYGRHVHEAVLAYGCKVSGATVHIVSEEYDSGPPILQQCVPVLDDDTPESLAARILPVEHSLLPRAVGLFAEGRVHVQGRRVIIREASK